MKSHKYYFVYKTTNLINRKLYIGVHITNNLGDGYLGSGTLLLDALEKYGKSNFRREILLYFNSLEEALEKEEELVNEEFIAREDTYNIYLGGSSGFGLNYRRCDWCGKIENTGNYSQYHGIYCVENPNRIVVDRTPSEETIEKLRKIKDTVEKIKCKWCNKLVLPWHHVWAHGNYCDKNPKALPRKKASEETKQKMKLSHLSKAKLLCPYCKKEFDAGNYSQYHGEFCKNNPNKKEKVLVKCEWCSNLITRHGYSKYHGSRCKKNPNSDPYSRMSKEARGKISVKVRNSFKECPNCQRMIDPGNYNRHYNKCSRSERIG